MTEKPDWQLPAKTPDEYHLCEMTRGREFLIRMMSGADPVLAIQKFAADHNIRFGKVHATFMGAFQPAKYYVWAPDTANPGNWHHEEVAVNHNLSMLLAVGGMIGVRPKEGGGEEPFVAMHFVSGGAWDTGVFGGHIVEGTTIVGCMQVFITEILDVDVLTPVDEYGEAYTYPENWYKSTK
jgi:predicted DNA-binding protein with PD1-like motif